MGRLFGMQGIKYTLIFLILSLVFQPILFPQEFPKSDINVIFKEGIELLKKGNLEEAQNKFEEILKINPYYEPARQKIRFIQIKREKILEREKLIANRRRLLEIENKWFPSPYKRTSPPEKLRLRPFKTKQQLEMEERAMQIIPEINFTDAHLRDVVQYLSRISGINIILDENVFVTQAGGEIGIPQKIEVTPTGSQVPRLAPSIISDRVTISLKNIPLIEALKYILRTKGLKYRIDEYAIVISTPERLQEEEMETRYYHLVSGIGTFTEYVAPEEEERFGWETEKPEEEKRLTIKDVILESGVPFPTGSKIFLDQRTGTLIVRNTPSNLSVIEDVLRTLDITPYQIEIEAKYVIVTQETAKELGLEWMITGPGFRFGEDKGLRIDPDTTDLVYGAFPDPRDITGREGGSRGLRFLSDSNGDPMGNIISITGVLTDPEFKAILHALNQSGDANVISAPRVTTLNNQRAQIRMVEEFIYPGEFEIVPPTVGWVVWREGEGTPQSRISSTVKVLTPGMAVPVTFEERDIGIVLNVTPSVGADRKTITLTLIPEISEFVQWMDYGIHPTSENSGWNDVPILKPIFRTRQVTTSVVINDGETVVLGGLIEERMVKTSDKIPLLGDIPILGRLFRSETERIQQSNLIIFVTARLLSPSGKRLKDVKEHMY